MMQKMVLLSARQHKPIRLQMFGRFNVLKDGTPLPIQGKTKEILALVACRRGKEISNEEIYSVIWEGREYSNEQMKTYYNALHRLKHILADNGAAELLISTPRGQMLNTALCDCDYYDWLNNNADAGSRFEGEFPRNTPGASPFWRICCTWTAADLPPKKTGKKRTPVIQTITGVRFLL